MKHIKKTILLSLLFFVVPFSDNYKLDTHSFGAGGGVGSSDSYDMQSIAGQTSTNRLDATTYDALPGLLFTQMANTPTAPTFTNASSYYNKLNLIINTASNPTNTQYAIAISSDDFVTTQYVQSDNTVGATLGSEDWQTYTNWGGATGEFVVGLTPNTTYKVKVKARQGEFTEGPFGPTATAATVGATLTFDIDVSASDEETAAPYSISLGSLAPDTVVTSVSSIWIDLSTNAASGGSVYVLGGSGGLHSASSGYTIAGVSADLTAVAEGFGLRSLSVTQSSGGPFAAVSPYAGASDVVGTLATTATPIFNTTNAPITNARGAVSVKAKTKSLTPAANDYTETVTFIAAALF